MKLQKQKELISRLLKNPKHGLRLYEAATARRSARCTVLWHEKLGKEYWALQADFAELEGEEPPEGPDEEYLAALAAAQKLLGEDTDERCAQDQETIEAYELAKYGVPVSPYGMKTRARTREELWPDYLHMIFRPDESMKRHLLETEEKFPEIPKGSWEKCVADWNEAEAKLDKRHREMGGYPT